MTTEKTGFFARLANRLKYPHLFLVVLALFGIDLAIPDAIPFIDEALLGFMTVLFGAWRKRKEERLEAGKRPEALPPPRSDE
mgnify:CR=1 FL=1